MMRSIDGIEDMRPYAEKLARQLDDAFKPAFSADENRRLFTNQEVSAFAVLTMSLMGWVD